MLPLQDNMPTASLFPQNLKRFLRNYQFVRCWNLFVWFSFQSLTVTQALFFMNQAAAVLKLQATNLVQPER